MPINRTFFLDHARTTLFGGKMSPKQVEGATGLLDEWETNHAKKDDRWLAYIFATAHHEVDRKMQPISEYGSNERKRLLYDVTGNDPARARLNGNTEKDDGVKYAGRGFVQLTWKNNYKKLGDRIGRDLVGHPELALDLDVATQVLFTGMMEGLFTGRKLSQYFNTQTENWKGARYIINGQDKADNIADYGRQYYACISYTTG